MQSSYSGADLRFAIAFSGVGYATMKSTWKTRNDYGPHGNSNQSPRLLCQFEIRKQTTEDPPSFLYMKVQVEIRH